MKILFTNCEILQRNINGKYYSIHGFLGVDGEYIDYIGENKPSNKYDLEKDMSGKLLMPGLINAHCHTPMTLLRGVGGGQSLQSWLNNCIFPIEAKMTPYDIEVGTRLAVAEMLRGGTTQVSEMYDFPYSSAKVFAETGMKANLCRTGLCFDASLQMKDWPRFNEVIDVAKILSLDKPGNDELFNEINCKTLPDYMKKAAKSGQVKGDLSVHSEYLSTSIFVKEMSKYANTTNYYRQVHASENKQEVEDCLARQGTTPIMYLYNNGFLNGGHTYIAHCVHATDEELEVMKKTGTTLVHNPTSNMKLGSGIARISEALRLGVNVALGTDGCASNNNLDMFEEMHLAALLQSGFNNDPTAASSHQVIDMATINGARALGRPDTGLLEVKYKADVIALDLSSPHLFPNHDIAELIVYSAHASDVCLTMVDGKILYEDGKYTTLDLDKIKQEANKVIEHLFK